MKLLNLLIVVFLTVNLYSQKTDKADLLDKYYSLGMPSLNRSWTIDDYKQAIGIILEQNKTQGLELPAKRNNAAGILNKITDYSDYWFFKSEAFSTKQKAMFFVQLQEPLGQLTLVYSKLELGNSPKLKYSYESIRCQLAILNVLGESIDLVKIFLEESPNLSEIQKEGLIKMQHGVNTAIAGMLQTLEKEFMYYDESDICMASNVFFPFYNKVRSAIDEVTRNELDSKIKKIHSEAKLACIRGKSIVE